MEFHCTSMQWLSVTGRILLAITLYKTMCTCVCIIHTEIETMHAYTQLFSYEWMNTLMSVQYLINWLINDVSSMHMSHFLGSLKYNNINIWKLSSVYHAYTLHTNWNPNPNNSLVCSVLKYIEYIYRYNKHTWGDDNAVNAICLASMAHLPTNIDSRTGEKCTHAASGN